MPQNLDAERGVLSALLQGADPLPAFRELSCKDFFHKLHGRLYEYIKRAVEEELSLSITTIADEMKLDQMERAEVAELFDRLLVVRNSNDLAGYVQIVKRDSRHRILLDACEKTIQSIGDAHILAAELQLKAKAYLESLTPAVESTAWREMFHSYEDFESAPPLNFAIDGFLQNDGATMIGGLSGHGKTLVNLSIAKALLAGKGAKLWDLFAVTESAVRVVYLIPECSLTPFKHRLRLFGLYDYLRPEDGRLLVRTLSKGVTPCLSDPHILFAAKGAHVILDTAVRFGDGDENSAGDNQRGLAKDIFALLGAGARSVIGAHHSPKPFAKESVMTLEGVLRGSGDVGAMLTTCWGIKQLDADQNIIHVQNVKPRDFQPCGPFQIVGRPFINETGDFRLHKRPGECGSLMEEQESERSLGGASPELRQERVRRIAMVREWLDADQNASINELQRKFKSVGVEVSAAAVKKYKREAAE